ncbi:Permease of the drug/metabolite transporter (DMT) superfamily [Pseudoalteromonas luteoviolacea B = ATCC 29581]|nr:Permease of the drug/metabolite transporter (DMT) superfamily [Pseudoalteromonas luteoviolacea B = ATCC 29581]
MIGFFYLILLGAIWGGSFLFMRIAVPSLGPSYLIEFRVLFAALTLSLIAFVTRRAIKTSGLTQHYIILGLFNSALPFLLFAYAAQYVSASVLSVLNSTAPFWGVIIAAIWLKHEITLRTIVGCICGLLGVAALVNLQTLPSFEALLPILAALGATCCYGIASNYTKIAPKVGTFDNAHGNLWASTVLVLPMLSFSPMPEMPTTNIFFAVLALGVVCTGIAYILYFKLIELLGAAQALTVTFLIPLFGILWGHVFLDEPIGPNTLIGALLVIMGVMLVTGVKVQQFLPWRRRMS